MPISTIPNNDRRERFVASAGQTIFPFDFPIYAAADLAVIRLRGGVETTLTFGADYSVTGANEQAGGTITLTAGSLAGDILTLTSAQVSGRQAAFTDGGALPAASLEAEFNRLTIQVQQIQSLVARGLRLADTDNSQPVLPVATQRANRILAFDADGSPIPTAVAVGSAVVTPFAQTLLDDLDANAALTTLGVSAYARTLLDDADANAALTTLGVSAFARTLLDDTSSSVARSTLEVPLIPSGSRFLALSTLVGSGLALPGTGGQTWAFFAQTFTAAGAATGTIIAGSNTGGTVIDPGIPGQFWTGFAFRIT